MRARLRYLVALVAIREAPSPCPVMRWGCRIGLAVLGAVWGAILAAVVWHAAPAALALLAGLSVLVLYQCRNRIPSVRLA